MQQEDLIATPGIGDIIRDEFLVPLGITPYRLSKELNVSTSSILDLVNNRRKITVEMSLRLAKYFGNSHRFWLNLQNELEVREARSRLSKDLDNIHVYCATV